ncbi:MAG: amidase, partial [Acidimicrobiia bacterium]|nr:amidase [Acidimicrobiia bacterium]
MAEIWQWNTSTTAERIRSGDISAREVADAHLARLDEVNPLLNAVTNDVRESAIAREAELDESFSASGPAGALHGVPVTIKENIDVEGQVTPNGMLANAEVVAPADSPLVSHFKNAGAVIIGRTNTPEMSYRWHTDNPLRGQTHNPWS